MSQTNDFFCINEISGSMSGVRFKYVNQKELNGSKRKESYINIFENHPPIEEGQSQCGNTIASIAALNFGPKRKPYS